MVGVVIAWLLQAVLAPVLGPFHAKLLLDIGIAIMLAVVAQHRQRLRRPVLDRPRRLHGGRRLRRGGLTYYGSIKLWGQRRRIHGGFLGAGDLLFLGACLLGGVVAALAGFVVGLPSLRLRGDYLAIVTLGFGEIVRVIVQQTGDVAADAAEVTVASTLELGHQPWAVVSGSRGAPTYTPASSTSTCSSRSSSSSRTG